MDAPPKYEYKLVPLFVGFVLSLLLVSAAYVIVTQEWLHGMMLGMTIVELACAQALVQLICFFHIGMEEKPRWNLVTFLFMLLIVLIVVGGSLWIMYNLDYHMGGVPH